MRMRLVALVAILFILMASGAFALWIYRYSYPPWANESGQFCDTDSAGKLWVTDYGTPGVSQLIVYDHVTSPALAFITTGLLNDGVTVGSYVQAGGVAYDPTEDLIYAITRDADTVTAGNQNYMYKYNPATLAPAAGCDLTTALLMDNPGDIDVITSGTSYTYVVFTNKVAAQWGIFDPRIPVPVWIEGPFVDTGSHINRGISATPDGTKVFLGDESDDDVDIWDKRLPATPGPLYTKRGAPLEAETAGNHSACEVDQGDVLVSLSGAAKLKIYDANTEALIDTVSDGILTVPRGAAYSNDGQTLYIVQFTGLAPVVRVYTPPQAGVEDWLLY